MSTAKAGEGVAIALTVLGTVGAVAAPFYADRAQPLRLKPDTTVEVQVINLTGVAAQGVWTAEAVNGANYWRPLRPATPVVHAGREVIIRLQSADDEHGFTIPELGVGPIKVEAGHVAEVRFTPQVPGRYAYQCTTRCGRCHEGMTGALVVVGPAETSDMYPPTETEKEKKPCH